jgi:hypothetical protein
MNLLFTDVTKLKRFSLGVTQEPKPTKTILVNTTEVKGQEIDKLISLAHRVTPGEDSYSKEEVIDRIKEATNVNQERAERGFNLLLKAKIIEPTPRGKYYLATSTPF